jgi:hypothetical protein
MGERDGEWFERVPGQFLPSSGVVRERVLSVLDAFGGEALVRPHARHLVSDVPGSLALVRRERPLGLVIEPAALFEPGMIEAAADHFERMGTALGSLARVWVVSDVRRAERGGEPWCEPVELGLGALPLGEIVRQARRALMCGATLAARSRAEAQKVVALLASMAD